MDGLEKLSQQEFDKLYDEYTVSADKSSEFYIAIEKNVKDIREIDIDNATRESLYAQVIESIYRNDDFKKMGNSLNMFFEGIERLFSTVIDVSEKTIHSQCEVRQELYKTKWYQEETSQKLAEMGKTVGNIAENSKKIEYSQAQTQEHLKQIKKDQEGRNKIYEN